MNRLFDIIYILLNVKVISAKELAERLEVSPRTIYRDIDMLSAAGVPVYMIRGKGGGISLLSDFIMDRGVLTQEEKIEILSSLQAMDTVSSGRKRTALQKLKGIFKTEADWIEVEFSTWQPRKVEESWFEILKDAVCYKHVVSFLYANSEGKQSKRTVEPLKLCYKSSCWYLYAYCRMRRENRFFKLMRMKDLHMLSEVFLRQTPLHVLETIGKAYEEEQGVRLKLRLSSRVSYRVFEEFDSYEKLADGDYLAELSVKSWSWIYYYIATFGSDCEVLEPAEVRDQVKKVLQKTLELYL